ncbi:MAG: hypothetical protein QMC36_05330 [Patescibacteria group bacterium]
MASVFHSIAYLGKESRIGLDFTYGSVGYLFAYPAVSPIAFF